MGAESILHTVNLGKRFKRRWAVRSLNIEVARGDIFGFLGPNGAGKSTTIRMLLSLVEPTEGQVELFGRDLRINGRESLSRIGGLVERADFYPYLSARRNLEIVASLMGGIAGTAIDEVLDLVGLLQRAGDKVKTYSHGMKQRLGIAQALLGKPELVILDEPTSGLDPQGIKEVRELVKRLATERGLTVFLSSHLLTEVEQIATHMAIINRGQLVVQGKVDELLNAAAGHVRIDARPIDLAVMVVRGQQFVKQVNQSGSLLDVDMPLEHAATLNTLLVQAGIEVRSFVPRRSLEDYFLSITEGATDIR